MILNGTTHVLRDDLSTGGGSSAFLGGRFRIEMRNT